MKVYKLYTKDGVIYKNMTDADYYQRTFEDELNERLVETDWIHFREMDRSELIKGKHSKFTQLCQYREDLRDMDKSQDFDVTNPIWPTKPE